MKLVLNRSIIFEQGYLTLFLKVLKLIFQTLLEERVSDLFHLSLSYFVMLC